MTAHKLPSSVLSRSFIVPENSSMAELLLSFSYKSPDTMADFTCCEICSYIGMLLIFLIWLASEDKRLYDKHMDSSTNFGCSMDNTQRKKFQLRLADKISFSIRALKCRGGTEIGEKKMKSTLVKDTTKLERIQLINQGEEEEGYEDSGLNLMEYFRDYIDGKKDISEVNAEFQADYAMTAQSDELPRRGE